MAGRLPILCVIFVLGCLAAAQQGKNAPAKSDLTGHYEGIAKDKGEEVITVALDLIEKEGAFSGTIHSAHGDYPITGGTHKDDAVTIEFDAGGPGVISVRLTEDKLSGTWNVGEYGGSIDLKKAAAPDNKPKDKS